MDGKHVGVYLKTVNKGPAPFSVILSLVGFGTVVFATLSVDPDKLIDFRSFLVVIGGTLSSLLFQYDLKTLFGSLWMVVRSFIGTPHAKLGRIIRELDEAILNNTQICGLRDGRELSGELLNDVVYMVQRGLLVEEIEAFLTSRISEEFLQRKTAVMLLRRAAIVAPAFGLFGTVIGLIGVLHSMDDPSQIGASMALALMTTAYGAGLSSLMFTPMAGRLESHNSVLLEVYRRMMTKLAILLHREERKLESVRVPTAPGDAP